MMNCSSGANKIETELVVQQRWLTEQPEEISRYPTMVRLHVMTLAGISEMRDTLNTQVMVDVEPREGERQAQMPRWRTHTLIQFASPEIGKELLHLRYLTVTSLLSSFADLGLPALREGADVAALRHSVGRVRHAATRRRPRLRDVGPNGGGVCCGGCAGSAGGRRPPRCSEGLWRRACAGHALGGPCCSQGAWRQVA